MKINRAKMLKEAPPVRVWHQCHMEQLIPEGRLREKKAEVSNFEIDFSIVRMNERITIYLFRPLILYY